jgi:hypothetical protein
MWHRNVTLEDSYGDRVHGVEHVPTVSDLPGTITVGSTRWFTTVWAGQGWSIVDTGEWEL